MKFVGLIIFQIILSAHACNSEGDICNKELKEAVSKNWEYDSAKNVYQTSRAFTKQLDSTYRECLIGKDSSYISKLFGASYSLEKTSHPALSEKFPQIMQYTLYKACNISPDNSECYYYVFYLTPNGKVGRAGYEQSGKSTLH